MSRRFRAAFVRGALVLVALATASALFGPAPAAGAPAAAEWQPTGLADQAWRLMTPASGAFFAQTASGLLRSDDGGATWNAVPLPPGLSAEQVRQTWASVDPNDHTRLYIGNWASRDEGATWSILDPAADSPDARVRPVPSPADPNLLYLTVTSGGPGTGNVIMRRSRDGGATWETFLQLGPGDFRPSSTIVVTLLEPHPSDPNVVFQSVVGARGSGNQGVLRRSADQGLSFQEVLSSPLRSPVRLVGGLGAAPARLYAAMSSQEVASALYRSDDGGVTWTEAATFGSAAAPTLVYGLEYDPEAPDRVWVGLEKGGVKASEDGGQTWTDIGLSDLEVTDLALGIDGANLFAATRHQVFRLPLR